MPGAQGTEGNPLLSSPLLGQGGGRQAVTQQQEREDPLQHRDRLDPPLQGDADGGEAQRHAGRQHRAATCPHGNGPGAAPAGGDGDEDGEVALDTAGLRARLRGRLRAQPRTRSSPSAEPRCHPAVPSQPRTAAAPSVVFITRHTHTRLPSPPQAGRRGN